jgi:hypothetical protein
MGASEGIKNDKMIKFFRKIRQKLLQENKVTQYLTYAIGEILLVVIGILIALQVNNWNENRKYQREAVAILKNLKSELSDDFSMMAYTIERLERRKAAADYLYQLISNDAERVEIDSTAIVAALMRCSYIHKFVPSFAVYNEIQNSGKLNLIRSDSIKKHLANYKSRVEESLRVESPYEITIKDFEKKAINFLSEIPFSENKILTERYSLINFNLFEIQKDKAFLSLLKHISYITTIELNVKKDLLIPRLEDLEDSINKELLL